MGQRIDFKQFLSALKAQILRKATINLLMVTDDRHSLWIGLRGGKIESLMFGARRGMVALSHMHAITGGTLRLDQESRLPPTPGLPDTETLLQLLDAVGSGTPSTISPGSVSQVASLVQPPSSSTQDHAASKSIDSGRADRIVSRLRARFQQEVGPIAGMVVSDLLDEVGGVRDERSLREFIDGLVREVDGIGDVDAFRAEAERLAK